MNQKGGGNRNRNDVYTAIVTPASTANMIFLAGAATAGATTGTGVTATTSAISAGVSNSIAANASSRLARWLKKLRYPFQPTAIAPPNRARNSSGTNQKLTAVTAGHSLQELMYAVGMVFLRVSTISRVLTVPTDEKTLCRVKKAARKTGVKKIWFTSTRVEIDSSLLRKLKDSPRYLNLKIALAGLFHPWLLCWPRLKRMN
jgi:hypothetical protein